MAFEMNVSDQIMEVVEKVTKHQTATIKKHHGMAKRLVVACDKTEIALNEELLITFKWQDFDLNVAEDWVDYPAKTTPILIDVAGITDELIPENGEAGILFSSAEPGTHIIKTVNPGVDNAYLEVVVNAA